MVNVHGVARLGVLALGLGIGVAWAHMPVASADSSGDWLSSVDGLLSGASPASAAPLDLGISFDGYNIYTCDCGTVAGTAPGEYGLAIAYGDNASAFAGGPGGLAVALAAAVLPPSPTGAPAMWPRLWASTPTPTPARRGRASLARITTPRSTSATTASPPT